MPSAVLLYFDAVTEKKIEAVWEALAEAEVDAYLHQSANRPHIKLTILDDLEPAAAGDRLRNLAVTAAAIPVDFKHFGIFPQPKPSIFLGAAVTEPLLEIKAQVDHALLGLGTSPPYDFFLPGHWAPHCLLALEIERDKLAHGLEVAMRLPLSGRIEEIGVIEFSPVKHLMVCGLGQAHSK